ncbi:MAG TPA: DUF4270 family protein [Chryseolinea sp.]
MKRFLRIIFSAIIFCSCEGESPQIGADFFTDGVLDFTYIDSVTINLSTVSIEELVTGSASRMLVGTHRDKQLGKLNAIPYFQVLPSEEVNFKDKNFAYDHLSLVLPLDHYSYYDTLLPLTLNVYRVGEDIKTEKGYLYNSSTFQLNDEILGTVTLRPKPSYDSIEIHLSDAVGQEIFEKAQRGHEDLTAGNFLKYIRGFAVLADTSRSSSILGIGPNPSLRVHYQDKSTTPVTEKYIAFDVQSGSGLFFTNITCDRKNTFLEEMPSEKDRLRSAETNGTSYIQAGAGLALRADLPYLRMLKQLSNFYVVRALMEIYPVRKSFNQETALPGYLKVFKADKANRIYEEVEATATLVSDIELGRDTYYLFDATEFVKGQMELQSLNENALIFTTDKTTYPVSADRVYAAAPDYQYKTRLRIYFATVNN